MIGDDGLEGIVLGYGSPLGEAHLELQQTILDLKNRGVLIAVCSKNEDDIARQPFREHPDMILKETDISVFQANWRDKATNIRAISEYLSLGLDSFVFLDDNPAERERVKQMLPEVSVPELPDDPAEYSRFLTAAGYFETTTFSEEDKNRADLYARNAKRLELQSAIGSYEEYLASLEMLVSFNSFDQIGRSRITQLINKTNQFNLTTKDTVKKKLRLLKRIRVTVRCKID